MGFGPYKKRVLVDTKAGFGICPKCHKQTLQTREYEEDGKKIFVNVCVDRENCGYERELN